MGSVRGNFPMRSANEAKPGKLEPQNTNWSLHKPAMCWLQSEDLTYHKDKAGPEILLRMKPNNLFHFNSSRKGAIYSNGQNSACSFSSMYLAYLLLTAKMSICSILLLNLRFKYFFKSSSIEQCSNLGEPIILLYGFNNRRNKIINDSQKETDNPFCLVHENDICLQEKFSDFLGPVCQHLESGITLGYTTSML